MKRHASCKELGHEDSMRKERSQGRKERTLLGEGNGLLG